MAGVVVITVDFSSLLAQLKLFDGLNISVYPRLTVLLPSHLLVLHPVHNVLRLIEQVVVFHF